MPHRQPVELSEPIAVPDVFVSGLAEVEDLGGGCFRFTFFAKLHGERVVAARLIAPVDAVPPALFMAAKAIGYSLVGEMPWGGEERRH